MQDKRHIDTINKYINATLDIVRCNILSNNNLTEIDICIALRRLVTLKINNERVNVVTYLKSEYISPNNKEKASLNLTLAMLYYGFKQKDLLKLSKLINVATDELTLLRMFAIRYLTTHTNVNYIPTFSESDFTLDELRQVHSYEESKKIIESSIANSKNKIDAVNRLKLYFNNKYLNNYRPSEFELKDKLNGFFETYKNNYKKESSIKKESYQFREDNLALLYYKQDKDILTYILENKLDYTKFNNHLNALKNNKDGLYKKIYLRREQELDELNKKSESIIKEFNNYIKSRYQISNLEGSKVSLIDYMRMYKDYPIEILIYYVNRKHPKNYTYFTKFIRKGFSTKHQERETLYNKSTTKQVILSYNKDGSPKDIYTLTKEDLDKIYDSLVEEKIPANSKTFNVRASEYIDNIKGSFKSKLLSTKKDLLEEEQKRKEIEEDLLERILSKNEK